MESELAKLENPHFALPRPPMLSKVDRPKCTNKYWHIYKSKGLEYIEARSSEMGLETSQLYLAIINMINLRIILHNFNLESNIQFLLHGNLNYVLVKIANLIFENK